MKKLVLISILMLPTLASAQSPQIPPNVKSFYSHLFPGTIKLDVVASATNNGIVYYQLYGESQAQDLNTSAILAVSPTGSIIQLDEGHQAGLDPDPCYVIKDPAVWRALQSNFVLRQTEKLGHSTVQNILDKRVASSYFMAQSYAEAGYAIPSSMRLYLNESATIQYTPNQTAPEPITTNSYVPVIF